MRVLVCGGRDFDDLDHLMKHLNFYTRQGDTIITGDACGADWLARSWAKYSKRKYKSYTADWKILGKSARNKKVLEETDPDLVVAFSGGAGTKNMVNLAKLAGVKVVEV